MTSTLRPAAQAVVERQPHPQSAPPSFWRDNAPSLACLGAFLVFVVGMTITGWHQFNADQLSHHESMLS